MQYTINYRPNYAVLEVDLAPREILVAESGAMMAKSSHLGMEPSLSVNPSAGFGTHLRCYMQAALRKMVGGETFMVTHFTSDQPSKILVVPPSPGDITHHSLDKGSLYVSSSSYLASMGDIEVDVKWGGLKGLLAKEGLFNLLITGTGDLWISSFGGIEPIDVDGDYVVDNGHVVAWESSLSMKVGFAATGSFFNKWASAEGLVCHFKGKGRLYIQTRNYGAFGKWIDSFFA